MKSAPLVSVIIPCYNAGEMLLDAINSIRHEKFNYSTEIIIINDGSTDPTTISILGQLDKEGYTILHQDNKGPAAARNSGVKAASGEYYMFLDSDNKLRSNYINKGVPLLMAHKDIGVVYGIPEFFGEQTTAKFVPMAFDKIKMLEKNFIDMCVLMRKKVWLEQGELDENRLMIGVEDWEYWIRLGFSNWKFYFLEEICFDYRVRKDSLVESTSSINRTKEIKEYLILKYYDRVFLEFKKLNMRLAYESSNPFRTFLKRIIRKQIGGL
jgi:glycosyltransferase involved in cell wall biosynthesis